MGDRLVPLNDTLLRQYVALYDGNIHRGDAAFGTLLSSVYKRLSEFRTIVIVAADHGESLGEHKRFDHNSLYHGVLRTPLIIPAPRAAATRSTATMNVDIFPTVLGLLGIASPPGSTLRGMDLLHGTARTRRQFAEYRDSKSLKEGALKLYIRKPSAGPPVLFDLSVDPFEQNDLAAAQPETTRRLVEEISKISSPAASDPLVEHLRALGYLR